MAKNLGIDISADASQAKAALRDFFDLTVRGSIDAKRELNKALGSETTTEVKIIFTDDGSGRKVAQVIEREINPAADKLVRNYAEANKLQDGSLTRLRQQVNEAKQARDAISRIALTTDEYGKTVAVSNQQWVAANQRVAVLNKALEQAGASTFWSRLKSDLNLQGIISFGQGISQAVNIFQSLAIIIQQVTGFVGQFVNALKQVQAIQLTYQAIGQGLEGASIALQESSRIALGLGVDLKTVRQGFQQLSPAILQSGGSLEDVSAITQALSSRFAVFGKSADESKRIMNGVIQAFGKGKLMAEELNQQISEADPAFRIDLANAIGVSVERLNEMVKAGEINTKVLLRTLPLLDKSSFVYGKLGTSALDAANALAAGNVTVTQAEAKIAGLNQLTLERFSNEFKGASAVFLGFQAVVVDFFSEISKTEAVKTLSSVLQSVGQTILTITNVVLQAVVALVKLFDPILKLVNELLKFDLVLKALGLTIVAFATVQLVSIVGASINATKAIAAQAAATLGLSAAQNAGIASGTAYAAAQNLIANPVKGLVELFGGLGSKITQAFSKPLPFLSRLTGKAQEGFSKQVLLTNAYTKFGTESAEALKKGASGMDAFSTAVGKTRIAQDKSSAASAAWRANIGGLIAGFATFALVAAAVTAVTAAWNTFTTIGEKAEAVMKSNDNIAKAMKGSYEVLTSQIGTANAAWEGAIQRVGRLQATLDILRRALGLSSVETAALNNEIVVSSGSFSKVEAAAQGGIKYLDQLAKSTKTSQEKIAEGQPVYTALLNSLDQVTARNNKRIKELQNSTFATKEEQEAAMGMIAELERENGVIAENRERLLERAKALGLNVAQTDTFTAAVDAEIKKMEELGNSIREIAQAEIDAIKNKEKASLLGPEKQKKTLEENHKTEMDNISKLKNAEQRRWDIEKSNIDRNKENVDRYYSDQLTQLRRVLDAENAIYDARLAALGADTPAETQLKALQADKLRKEAATAETQEERLRARAQLERIEREKQIDKVRAEQAANQKRREREQQKLEDEALREKRRVEDEGRKAEAEHKFKMDKLEDEERKKKETYNSTLKGIETEIANIKEKSAAEVQKWEALIEQSNLNIAKAKWAQVEAANGVMSKEQFITRQLESQLEILKEIDRLRRSGGTTAPTPTGAAPKVAPKVNNLAGSPDYEFGKSVGTWIRNNLLKAGGGPVSGGSDYIVNELGQESFLSRSGKLTPINAPSWGQWRAPGAGTVIPAHITAGLNIPSGGVSINRGAVASASASSNAGEASMSRLVAAVLGAPQGRVTNNVTIQSENATRSASDILVQLTKIKHSRYR